MALAPGAPTRVSCVGRRRQRPVLALPPRGVASSGCPTFPGGAVVRSFRKSRWPGSGAIAVPFLRTIGQVPIELFFKAPVFTGTRLACSAQRGCLSRWGNGNKIEEQRGMSGTTNDLVPQGNSTGFCSKSSSHSSSAASCHQKGFFVVVFSPLTPEHLGNKVHDPGLYNLQFHSSAFKKVS